MAVKKNSSLDRVLGRLDTLDSVNLANLVQRLARERGLFEEIFNVLQEGVLVISADGVIEYANAAAHRLIGIGDDELAGQTLWRLVPGLRPSIDAALDDGPVRGALPIVARLSAWVLSTCGWAPARRSLKRRPSRNPGDR